MSDRKPTYYEKEPLLLKKKSSRNKKPKNKLEGFDLRKFKDRLFNEMARSGSMGFVQKNEEIKSCYDPYSDYERRYKEYLQEGYTIRTTNFINRIILESTSLPSGLRTNFALHKIIINVVKNLMMNEIEIVYLSLYLDKLGWVTEGYHLDENLLMAGLSVKIYLNASYDYLLDHLSRKMRIKERFDNWLKLKENYKNSLNLSPRELNERYCILGRPFNTYCKQNYIDHNFIVDQILQMSLPYSEGKPHSDRNHSQDNSIYDTTPKIHREYTKKSNKDPIFMKFPSTGSFNNNNINPLTLEGIRFDKSREDLHRNNLVDCLKPNIHNSQPHPHFNIPGRDPSGNILIRDGSFNFTNEENYPFMRFPSQLNPFGNEEPESMFSKYHMTGRMMSNISNNYELTHQSSFPAYEAAIQYVPDRSANKNIIENEIKKEEQQDPLNTKQFSFEKDNTNQVKNEENSNDMVLTTTVKPLTLSLNKEPKTDKTLFKKYLLVKKNSNN